MSAEIAFVVPSLRGGGAEFVTFAWASELARRGHEVEVLLTGYGANEPTIPGVRIVQISAAGTRRSSEVRRLSEFLRGAPPDVLVAMMTRANIDVALLRALGRLRRSTVVISERNIPLREHDATRLHLAIRDWLVSWLYRRTDGLIAVSNAVGAAFYAKAGLRTDRVVVVPNPSLAKSGLKPATRREPHPSEINLVVPARLVAKKRPHLAFDIAHRLAASGMTVSLHFFGEGPLLEELSAREAAFRVEFHGFIPDWYDHAPQHSVMLLPSVVEGLPNVAIEAASRGIPSVVGPSTFATDAVVPGSTGAIALLDTPASYVEAVLRAASMTTVEQGRWIGQFATSESTDALLAALSYFRGTAS